MSLTTQAGVFGLPAQDQEPPGVALGVDAAAADKEVTVVADVADEGAYFITIAALNLNAVGDADEDGFLEMGALNLTVDGAAAAGDYALAVDQVVLTDGDFNDLGEAAAAVGPLTVSE